MIDIIRSAADVTARSLAGKRAVTLKSASQKLADEKGAYLVGKLHEWEARHLPLIYDYEDGYEATRPQEGIHGALKEVWAYKKGGACHLVF